MCLCVKIGMLVEVGDVIIQSNFGFNIFRGFRSYGGVKISIFPLTLKHLKMFEAVRYMFIELVNAELHRWPVAYQVSCL